MPPSGGGRDRSMAKKEKKAKKQKPEKRRGKRGRKSEQYAEPDIPYPGSERTRDFLIRLMIFLCCIALGLMIYSIHYFKYVDRTSRLKAEEAAEKAAASAPAVGTIWFSQPDGTFIRGDGSSVSAPSSAAPPLPSAGVQKSPAAANAPADAASAEGEAPAAEAAGAAEGGVEPTEPPAPADAPPVP